jgi:hypothetical protein
MYPSRQHSSAADLLLVQSNVKTAAGDWQEGWL